MASSSPQRQRQIELAIGEIAQTLSDPEASLQSPWLAWMKSSDFSSFSNRWSQLGIRLGRRLAERGWPLETPALDMALAHARLDPKFDESSFLVAAFDEGWKARGESKDACRWIEAMDNRLPKPEGKIERKQAKNSETSGLFDRTAHLAPPQKSIEAWQDIAMHAKQTLPWLWKCAFDSHRQSELANPADDWMRLEICAKRLALADRQEAMGRCVDAWANRPESDARAAQCANLLARSGADWTMLRDNPPTKSPLQSAVDRASSSMLAAAHDCLDPEIFWTHIHRRAIENMSSAPHRVDEQALTLAKALKGIDGMPKLMARLLLRAASCSALRNRAQPQAIAEAFELLGAKAFLHESDAWQFPGFSLDAVPAKGFGADLFNDEPTPEQPAYRWLARRHQIVIAAAQGRFDESAFGALAQGLARHGCPYPWRSEKTQLDERYAALQAKLDRWALAEASTRPAQDITSARGSRL